MPENPVAVGQLVLKDSIVGILILIGDAVSTLLTNGGHNGVKRTDNTLQAMLQGLVNKTRDEKINSVDFEYRLLREIERRTASRWQVKETTEAILDNLDSISPVETIFKKETKNVVDVASERENRREKFVEAAYSTGACSASSSG